MSMIDYLFYIKKNKGVLIGDEIRISDISQEDFEKLELLHYIDTEYRDFKIESISITKKGYDYISNLN